MDFRVFSRNISENMHARCVREDTKQALKGNLQADGVQSRQTLFVRYCLIKRISLQDERIPGDVVAYCTVCNVQEEIINVCTAESPDRLVCNLSVLPLILSQ